MVESSPNLPEQSASATAQPPVRLVLGGRWSISFLSVGFALGAAILLFDLFLQVRRLVLLKQGDLFWLSGLLLRGFSLTVIAILLWNYARAIRDYPSSGEAGTRRLERAHIDVWRWGAIFLAAHLLHAAAFIAARMPF
jgi:hypothetical protein